MSQEYLITATLTAKTALHIGTGQAGLVTDAPVRRGANGSFLIPGRALGGSLRTLATRLAPRFGLQTCQTLLENPNMEMPCNCETCSLFGNVHPVDPETELPDHLRARASRLWVYDALAVGNGRSHIRDGVGINRKTGAASSQVKFNYETIPPQTEFQWQLRLVRSEDEAINEATIALLAAALAEWQAGRGQIGGNAARGLGSFELTDYTVSNVSIQNADQLINYLNADEPDSYTNAVNWVGELKKLRTKIVPLPKTAEARRKMCAQSVSGSFLKLDFTLAFDDFFLSHDPIAGLISGFDHAPLLEFTAVPGEVGPPVLSGSSLRGVLRTYAEKIARTLATNHWLKQSVDVTEARDNFLQHCPACDVLAKEKEALASCDARLRILDKDETPAEALCWSCRLFGSQRRGSRLWVRDAAVQTKALSEKDWKAQDFLAIDRFTGGGLHHAKFDAAPLTNLSFAGQIVLHDPADWELGWLSLLLRDLADGRLTVGFGQAKGYGRVKAKNIVWTVGCLHKDDCQQFPLTEADYAQTKENGIYITSKHSPEAEGWLPEGWQEQAQTWVAQFNQIIVQTDQKDEHWQPYTQDSFFIKDDEPDLIRLYGISRAEVTHGD